MLVVTLATLGGTVYLYMIVPRLLPAGGHRLPDRVTEAATDTSFEAMKVRQQAWWIFLNRTRDRISQQHVGSAAQSDRQLRPAVHRAEPQKTRDNLPTVVARLR